MLGRTGKSQLRWKDTEICEDKTEYINGFYDLIPLNVGLFDGSPSQHFCIRSRRSFIPAVSFFKSSRVGL